MHTPMALIIFKIQCILVKKNKKGDFKVTVGREVRPGMGEGVRGGTERSGASLKVILPSLPPLPQVITAPPSAYHLLPRRRPSETRQRRRSARC